MIDNPSIIQSDELLTAVIHHIIPRDEIQKVMEPSIAEIMSTLAAQGIEPAGACFSYHLKVPSDTTFDFEVGFPIKLPLISQGRVKQSKLPATKVIRTIYRGGYEGLGAAWGEFIAWIESNGLKVDDSLWESYVSGPESSSDPSKWQTELNRPLVK